MGTLYPFFSIVTACLAWAALGFLVFLLAARAWIKLLENVMFARLKRLAGKNPGIGFKDSEGDFVYKTGWFTFKYRLIGDPDKGPQIVKCIAFKRKLSKFEEGLRHIRKSVHEFFLYKKWKRGIRPVFFILILAILALVYIVGLETEDSKFNRLRWIVAHTLRVGIDTVTVDPDGNVAVSGERMPKDGSQAEEVSYHFNVADWLTFRDAGFINRRIPSTGLEVVYPVEYKDTGAVFLKKNGQLVEGEFTVGAVRWNAPQGAGGIKGEEIQGKDEPRPSGKVVIMDK